MTDRKYKPLDDLSGNAIALLSFHRRHPLKCFVEGAPSTPYAKELERAGYLQLRFVYQDAEPCLWLVEEGQAQ